MDVKLIPIAVGLKINASSDTRKDGQRRDQPSKKKEEAKAVPSNEVQNAALTANENQNVIPSDGQMIDSEKVLELLSHRPTSQKTTNAFKKLADLNNRESKLHAPISDGKKVGKYV